MKLVDLAMEYGVCGLIVPMATGVVYTNQTGGTCCMHPRAEGIFVPLNNNLGQDVAMTDRWNDDSITSKLIDEVLCSLGLRPDLTPPLEIPAGEWGEAWIPVIVRSDSVRAVLQAFRGVRAILTYENSD